MDGITITDIAVHSILLFTGLTGNTFILAVHFLEWLKTKLTPCNLIINGISISNIFLQITCDFYEIMHYIFPEAFLQQWVINVTFALTSSLALSSLWCSTCLCFYYCVKIVDFKGAFFYKLKAKLPVTVPWLLVFSGVVSWGSGIPAVWNLYTEVSTSTLNATSNLTLMNMLFKSNCNCTFQINLFVASLAFVIIFFTTGMILTSLCKHILQMKQNNEGFGSSKVRAHLLAAKTVIALLILYLIFFAMFIYLINSTSYSTDITSAIAISIVLSIFPTINVLILIMGNRKYLEIWKKFLGMESNEMNTRFTSTT